MEHRARRRTNVKMSLTKKVRAGWLMINHSILFYSILFYTILFYTILWNINFILALVF